MVSVQRSSMGYCIAHKTWQAGRFHMDSYIPGLELPSKHRKMSAIKFSLGNSNWPKQKKQWNVFTGIQKCFSSE